MQSCHFAMIKNLCSLFEDHQQYSAVESLQPPAAMDEYYFVLDPKSKQAAGYSSYSVANSKLVAQRTMCSFVGRTSYLAALVLWNSVHSLAASVGSFDFPGVAFEEFETEAENAAWYPFVVGEVALVAKKQASGADL